MSAWHPSSKAWRFPLSLDLRFRQNSRILPFLFFDWSAPNHPSYSLLGVFWIRFLVGVRCCRSRVKGLSQIPFSKNINGNYEEMPLAA